MKHAEAVEYNGREATAGIVYRGMHLNFFRGFKNVVSENTFPIYQGTTLAECETKHWALPRKIYSLETIFDTIADASRGALEAARRKVENHCCVKRNMYNRYLLK